MGISRIVNTDFWTDETVIDYYSPEDKYFFLYLLTNPQSRQLGIYKLPKKIISFQTGYSAEAVLVLLDRFENKYKTIIYDHDTQEIAILNYLAYSVVRGGKPVMDCVEKDISLVKNKELIGMAYRQVRDKKVKEGVRQVIELLSIYNDIQNDNDIDNDNDSIVPRIVPRIVNRYKEDALVPIGTDDTLVGQDPSLADVDTGENNNGAVSKKCKEKQMEVEFKKVWKEYPGHKNTSAVSKKAKERVFKIGADHATRALKRYVDYVEQERVSFPTLKYQNGSTFFNTTIVDYLDENYEGDYEPIEKEVSRWQ